MANENGATNLRQSKLQANVVGWVSEIDLKKDKAKETGDDVINGSVTVKVDDQNSVTFNVYAAKHTKNKAENPSYKSIEAVLDHYNSIKAVGVDNATRVRVNGQIDPQTYVTNNGQVVEGRIRYRGSFFQEITNNFEPKAEAVMDIFIRSIIRETNKSTGEETGRLKVETWVNTFTGLEPVELVVPEDLADAFESTYEIGNTVQIYADIINSQVVTEVPLAFGKPKKTVSFRNELVISGGMPPFEDSMAFDPDAMRIAISEYENKKKNLKVKNENTEVKKAAPASNPFQKPLEW